MAPKVSKKKVAVVEENTEVKTEVKEAKKKAVAKKATTKRKAAVPKTPKAVSKQKQAVNNYPNAYLVVDHPVETETIYGNHYAIRIGASTDGYVEISFDKGEWQPCRFGGGYWWFDWAYFNKGDHSIAVRLMDTNGNSIIETSPRKCTIC